MGVLVTGASGQLGSYLLRHLVSQQRHEIVAWSGSRGGTSSGIPLRPVDLTDANQVRDAFQEDRPAVIIHAAAVSRIDLCYAQPELAESVNVRGTRQLVSLAADHASRFIYVSTDLVFDGRKGHYVERDLPRPLSRYGQSKLAAEQVVLQWPDAAVVRVSLLFGPSLNGQPSFFDQQLAGLREGRPVKLFTDEWRTPLSLATAATALVEVAASNLAGVLHIGGPERMSRWQMGQQLAVFLGCDPQLLQATRQTEVPFPEPRPPDVSLDSSLWRSHFPHQPWPTWEAALREMGLERGG